MSEPSTPTDGARHAFVDTASGRECVLVLGAGMPVVEHPDCDQPADVSVDLDAFYCPACSWNGRISGAWVVYLTERAPA